MKYVVGIIILIVVGVNIYPSPTPYEPVYRLESNCIDEYCSNHHGKPAPEVTEECDGELQYVRGKWECIVKPLPKATYTPVSGK